MRAIRWAAVMTAMVLLTGMAVAGTPHGEVRLPIQSKVELQRYLDATPIAESPLSRLSPMGRRRFLDGLNFTGQGIGGYGTADLMAELTAAEIRSVLALFDLPVSESLLRDAREVNRNDVPSRWPVPQEPTAIGRKFDQLRAIEGLPENPDAGLTYSGHSRSIGDGYDRLFGAASASMDAVSDSDLDLLFRATNIAMFWTKDPKYFDAMHRQFAELQARGLAGKSDYRVMHGALMLVRDFYRADAFAQAYHAMELEAAPPIIDRVQDGYSGPTEWAVSAEEYQLVHQPVTLDAPAKVIVVAHPGCGFSRKAMEVIESDPILGPLFAEHANWLAPQDGSLDIEQMQQWNREHPSVDMTLTVDAREWPMIDVWGTPIFYFFKDGELKAKVTGWPLDGPGRRDEVVAALGEIGLIE